MGNHRIKQETDARCRVLAQHRTRGRPRPDVALHEGGILREVSLGCCFYLGGRESYFGALEVDVPVSREPNHDELSSSIERREGKHDVLERVRRYPLASIRPRVGVVRDRHERCDRGGIRCVVHDRGGETLRRTRGRCESAKRFHVGRVPSRGAHKSVFADGRRVEKLFTLRASHCAGIRGDDDILEAQALEDALVCVPVLLIAHIESGV